MLFVFHETDGVDQVALGFGILPFPTTQLFLRQSPAPSVTTTDGEQMTLMQCHKRRIIATVKLQITICLKRLDAEKPAWVSLLTGIIDAKHAESE